MNKDDVLAMIASGGVPYTDVRNQIQSGDLLLLHHDFVPTLYGLQIAAVQEWTGPFAHIALLDRVVIGGEERVAVWESVVPKRRMVPVTATVEDTAGFFLLRMNRLMSADAISSAWLNVGKGDYSKPGAVLAGIDRLPSDEDDNPRMWCAKLVNLLCRMYGVDLGECYVPTAMAEVAIAKYGGQLIYVRMK
jgi:hypothetical protein